MKTDLLACEHCGIVMEKKILKMRDKIVYSAISFSFKCPVCGHITEVDD